MLLDRIRGALFHAITSPLGDSLAPVRVPKDLARRLNATLGRPFAPQEELVKRARARERLVALRAGVEAGPKAQAVAAPIVVYFEKDRNVRELGRIEELLSTKGYEWKRLDVAGDEATFDFVLLKAKCERDDLPVVFVADQSIGTYTALVAADVSGEFARAVRGG
jgi:glutaredoxin